MSLSPSRDELEAQATALIRRKGWTPGDRIHLHGAIQLLVEFGLNLLADPGAVCCDFPHCGCEPDAVCDAAHALADGATS